MYGMLIVSAIPAILAAGFDSPGFALLAAAGATWAAALYICSVAPVITGGTTSVNERLSTGMSVLAASLASGGALILTTAVLT